MQVFKDFKEKSESLFISNEGLKNLILNYDPAKPQKNIEWTTDITLELPIKLRIEGLGSEPPFTLIDAFYKAINEIPQKSALKVRRNNKWIVWTYKNYYEDCCNFAKALISIGMTSFSSVNIIGFNAPEWNISFFGSIFGGYLPVGIYTTNNPEACQYVASNSEAEVIVAENKEQLEKFLKIWDEIPRIKMIVLYCETLPKDIIPESRRSQVMLFADFLNIGNNFKAETSENSLQYRMTKQKPGNCCTLVYTSGTTGQPKGVMISHDNYTWTSSYLLRKFGFDYGKERVVSYLPLSHVAAQTIDVTGSVISGTEVTFATPDALQGSLVEILKEIKPTFFFSVPRVWEKIEEKMKLMASKNNTILRSLSTWAKTKGKEGTWAEINLQSPGYGFELAKKLVYNNVKKALGLDQAKFLMFGAAPLAIQIQEYFLSLNMFLTNTYGMSECSGPQTFLDPKNMSSLESKALESCGSKLEGTDLMLYNIDKEGNGEICYKGRNRFMGYFKNETATRETIDDQGFLHSGDVGKLDELGNLTITGRIKELLITAGGENIPPVLIENQVKLELPFISNAMLIGDQRKYLVILLTLKYDVDKNGNATNYINEEYLPLLKVIGLKANTYEELIKDQKFMDFIEKGIEAANKKAVSKAHEIKKWKIIPGDFTVEGGELTPTLKLKRKTTYEKYTQIIEQLYENAKL